MTAYILRMNTNPNPVQHVPGIDCRYPFVHEGRDRHAAPDQPDITQWLRPSVRRERLTDGTLVRLGGWAGERPIR